MNATDKTQQLDASPSGLGFRFCLVLPVLLAPALLVAGGLPFTADVLWEHAARAVVPADLRGDSEDAFIMFSSESYVVAQNQELQVASASHEFAASERPVLKPGGNSEAIWSFFQRADSLFFYKLWSGPRGFVIHVPSVHGAPWKGGVAQSAVADINGDGRPEFVMELVCGFARHPRGIITLDWQTGAPLWQFLIGPNPEQFILHDVDGDGRSEIVVGTVAPGNGGAANGTDDGHPCVFCLSPSGQLIWLRTFGEYPQRADIALIEEKGEAKIFVCQRGYPVPNARPDSLFILNARDGTTQDSASAGGLNQQFAVLRTEKGETRILVAADDDTVRAYDRNLRRRLSQRLWFGGCQAIVTGRFSGVGRDEIAVVTTAGQLRYYNAELHLLADSNVGEGEDVELFPVKARSKARLLLLMGSNYLSRLYELHPVSSGNGIPVWIVVLGGLAMLMIYGTTVAYVRYQRTRDIRSVIRSLTGRAGTIELNRRGEVTSTNQKARELLGTAEKRVTQIPTGGPFASLSELARAMLTEPEGTPPRELAVSTAPGQTSMVRCVRVKTGAVLTIEDISAVEYLQRVKAWAPVAQKLAHGIKNPLNTILGSVEQIELKVTDEKALKYMGYVKDEVTRLRKMSDAFMRFTKLNPPALQPKSINEVIKKVMTKYECRMTNDIELKLELDDKLPAIALDEEGLSNALEIVIENAVEAMSSSEQVADSSKQTRILNIRTSREIPNSPASSVSSVSSVVQGSIRIEIADTGKGIPAKYLEKVFEPYFTMGKPQGTGLGLALAKKIVEDHHGQMAITSQEGVGTQVSIILPVRS